MSDLGTEMAFEVLAEVTRLKALGHDIINFGIGEPDFPTPENIKAAGTRAIQGDRSHYTPSAGLQTSPGWFRKRISPPSPGRK